MLLAVIARYELVTNPAALKRLNELPLLLGIGACNGMRSNAIRLLSLLGRLETAAREHQSGDYESKCSHRCACAQLTQFREHHIRITFRVAP
jgi:hypothetical protein